MERNIESILSELGIDYLFYGTDRNNKTFRNVTTIQQGGEEDLCYCSLDGEDAISLISKSNAGIILCKKSLTDFINQGQKQQLQLSHKQQIILARSRYYFNSCLVRFSNKFVS
jgi:UDP-3-O-[3-hydroxymyristoyl] glucosamine N-acyltransferase